MTLTRLRSLSSRSKDLISILSVFSCSTLDMLHAAKSFRRFVQQVSRWRRQQVQPQSAAVINLQDARLDFLCIIQSRPQQGPN